MARQALQSRAATHGKPLHLARPAARRRAVPVVPPEPAGPSYEPGHFLALIRRHDWPPSFESQFQRTREVEQSELARINRERLVARGITGTIVGLTQRADDMILQRLTQGRALR